MPHRSKDYYLNNKDFKSKVFSDKKKLDKLIKLAETDKYPIIKYTGSQIFRILDYLYKESIVSIRLDRKYNRYLEFKNKFWR